MLAGIMGSLKESPSGREIEVSHSERDVQALYLGTKQMSEYLSSFILSVNKGVNGSKVRQLARLTEKVTLE